MDIIGIVIGVACSVVAVYVTKRRFGPLALALAVGSILSPMWAPSVTMVVAADVRTSLPLENIIGAILVVLPAFVVLLRGPSVHQKLGRIFSAVFFTLLAIVLLLVPLAPVLVVGAAAQPVYDILLSYKVLIITGGLVYGIVDVCSMRSPVHRKDASTH